jgi:hypothetical protein
MSDEPALDGLRQRAIAEGEALADRLAASIVLDASWFGCITEQSLSVRKLVAQLSQDPQVVALLARICANAARSRLEAKLRGETAR